MAITALPPVPQRSDEPATFVAKADAFLAALNVFRTELDAVANAMSLNAVNSTSTTSVVIGLGSKSFTVPTGKSYVAGMTLKIAATIAPSNYMIADVTSYNSSTGELVVNALQTNGSGTAANWTLSQSAPLNIAPTGTIIAFAGSAAPAGFLACPAVATNISRITYEALFAAIGTLWGAGDGSTTFGMPFFPVGYTAVQGGTVGAQTTGSTTTNTAASNTSADLQIFGQPPIKAAGSNVLFCVKY